MKNLLKVDSIKYLKMCDTDYIYKLEAGNNIHPTAIIYPNVIIGTGNTIGAYCVIGSNGEIRNVEKFEGAVIIGNNNTISEHVTIQRPSGRGKSTTIGNGNIIMAHSHVGHDAKIGNNCELSTGVIIGGYAVINDNVMLKLGVTVRNRKKVAKGAKIGMSATVVTDILTDGVFIGTPAKPMIKTIVSDEVNDLADEIDEEMRKRTSIIDVKDFDND